EELRQAKIRSTCEDGVLKSDIRGLIVQDEQVWGSLNYTLNMRMSEKGNLVQRQSGFYRSKNSEEYSFDNLITCTRFEFPSNESQSQN
ncbi:MAG: hypothetical protein AAF202_09630, partial [Pseudomonadota bacterium]